MPLPNRAWKRVVTQKYIYLNYLMEELKNELHQVPGPEISGPKLYFGDTWQRALRLWLYVDMHTYFLERSCSYQALTESAEPQSMQLEDNASVVFLFGLLLCLFPGLAPL